MRSPISTTVLLTEVLAVMRNKLQPEISSAGKYPLLMCINAVEIALRDLQQNDDTCSDDNLSQQYQQFRDQLAESGDDAWQTEAWLALHEQLRQANAHELAIANPRFKRGVEK